MQTELADITPREAAQLHQIEVRKKMRQMASFTEVAQSRSFPKPIVVNGIRYGSVFIAGVQTGFGEASLRDCACGRRRRAWNRYHGRFEVVRASWSSVVN